MRAMSQSFCDSTFAPTFAPAFAPTFAPTFARLAIAALGSVCAFSALGCEHFDRFSTGAGSLEGSIEASAIVRAGFPEGTKLCLTLDTNKLQTEPGTISTSDGLFARTALRPIPALASDHLSNLSFANGQLRNLVFAARANETEARDALAIVSLLDDGRVEVRLITGAPGAPSATGATGVAGAQSFYGVFALHRQQTSCSF